MPEAGFATYDPANRMERHRHRYGYAAIVVSGGYVEAGDMGRYHIATGQAVVHHAYEAHQDRFRHSGAVVLNLRIGHAAVPGLYRVSDPDLIIRLAERDLQSAAEALQADMAMDANVLSDWPDILAQALAKGDAFSITGWAEAMMIAPQSLSRGFRSAYGISPKAYRAECRALRAIRALRSSSEPLALVAADLGFADQAHLTRAVRGLCGLTPTQLRVQSVQ